MSGCIMWSIRLFFQWYTLYKIWLQCLVARKAQNALYNYTADSFISYKKVWLWACSFFLYLEMPTIGPIRACQGHLPSIRNQSLYFSPQLHTEKWKADRSTPILIQNTCSCTTSQGTSSLISIWKQMWKQFPWKSSSKYWNFSLIETHCALYSQHLICFEGSDE